MAFSSTYRAIWQENPIVFPGFTGLRVMIMPVHIGSTRGVPDQYGEIYLQMCAMTEQRHWGEVGYLTIDERVLEPGETLRRAGRHVDGYYHGRCGAWGGGGSWGSVGNGMLTVSSTPHCRAWLGEIDGEPGPEGECDHLDIAGDGVLFEAGQVYWLDGACVHESVPVTDRTERKFVRLSMPSNGPWFEGYTPNPQGVIPNGEILPRRDEFMS